MSIRCKHCKGYRTCEWRNPYDDTCWYEPCDHPGGIGSATAEEVRLQNESSIKLDR